MKASLFAFLLLLPTIAWAGNPNPYIGQAKRLYDRLEFEKCLHRIEQAGQWQNTPAEQAQIELYAGLCGLGLGNEQEALEHFEMALKLDPGLTAPPGGGPKVRSVFAKAHDNLVRESPELFQPKAAAPASELKTPTPEPAPPPPAAITPADVAAQSAAPAPATATATVAPARSLSAVPFVIAGVGVAAVIAASILGVQAKSFQQMKMNATFESDAVAFANQSQGLAIGADVLFAAASVALIAAIVSWFVLN
jgi:hypothetical protein